MNMGSILLLLLINKDKIALFFYHVNLVKSVNESGVCVYKEDTKTISEIVSKGKLHIEI